MDALKTKLSARTQLQLLAMAAMVCDHVGVMLGDSAPLRCIGRVAFPIYAFLTMASFERTQNKSRRLLGLLVLALVSELPYDLFRSGYGWEYTWSVIWSFLLSCGAAYLTGLDKLGAFRFLGWPVALYVALYVPIDYSIVGVSLCLLYWTAFRLRERGLGRNLPLFGICCWVYGFAMTAVSLASGGNWFQYLPAVFVGIFLDKSLENFDSPKPPKTFLVLYHWFYPIHFTILAAVKILLRVPGA